MPQFDELLRQCPKSFDQGCLKTPSIGKQVLNITKLREKLWIRSYSNVKKVTRCYPVTIIHSEIGGAQMNGFKCMLIEYPERTHGQETVKTLQQKASWSRVGLGLKWQVQNISTLSK